MCKWWGKKPIVEPETIKPTSTKRISISELGMLIRGKYPECKMYLSDRRYRLCSYDDIALFLAQDETNKMGYIPEKRDCDDFSYRLMGQFSIPEWSDLCFGIIWTYTHAFNCFVTEDKELLFVEPQNDIISKDLFAGSTVNLIVI